MVRLSATACNQNCVGVVLDRPSSLFESKRTRTQSCSSRWQIARKANGKTVATWSDTDHYNKGRFVKRRSLRSNPYETKVIRNGHYEVAMPWRPGAPNSSNYSQALVRLDQLKWKSRSVRGFVSNTQKYLKDTYVGAMPVKLSRLIAMFSFFYLIMVCSIRRSQISSVSSSIVRRSSTVDRSTTSCSPDQTWWTIL